MGDHVDVFRPTDATSPIATAAQVLAITGMEDPLAGGLLLALTPEEAQQAIEPTPEGYSIVIRPDG